MSRKDFDLLVFDFDGVLTDNTVLLREDGYEFVKCSRSDGLAFDVLRAIELKTVILSSETSEVVKSRAQKLKLPVFYGVTNKRESLSKYCAENSFDLARTLFVGNDLNDYYVMKACGASICPSDAHPIIKNIASWVTSSPGGMGVAREIVENFLQIDVLSILYSTQK